MALLAPRRYFVGPYRYLVNSVGPPPAVSHRLEASPSDPRLSFHTVNRAGLLAPSPSVMEICDKSGGAVVTYFGLRRTRFVVKGTALFGKAIRQVGGPGGVLCARGHGKGPSERFLCDADPGGLYEEREFPPHVPGAAAGSGAVGDVRGRAAPVRIGRAVLGCHCSRPDSRVRLAKIAPRIGPPCESDVYRINVPARAVKKWQEPAVLRYALSSHTWASIGFAGKPRTSCATG